MGVNVSFMPWSLYRAEDTLVPDEYEGKWAPEPVWTFWQGGKSLILLGI